MSEEYFERPNEEFVARAKRLILAGRAELERLEDAVGENLTDEASWLIKTAIHAPNNLNEQNKSDLGELATKYLDNQDS